MECDSFVTLGVDCSEFTDNTTIDPDFSAFKFNSTGEVSGGWYNSAPPNGQGDPDANGRVLMGRFSYKQNKNTSGDVCVFTQLAGSEDIIEFLLLPFDCANPGLQGVGGGGAPGGGGCPAGMIWYVDVDPIVSSDGKCCLGSAECNGWANACPDLQLVLNNGDLDPGDQVWVAEGSYRPSACIPQCMEADRSDSFQLASCLEIYGGFVGTEMSLGERDWLLYETILSGDLDGNDAPVSCTSNSPGCDNYGQLCVAGSCITPDFNGENSYHVVSAGTGTSSVDATDILDGFTVTKGNANGAFAGANGPDQGSAVNIWINSTPRLENCTFRQNWSDFHATVNDHGGATLIDCDFRENHSDDWAGGLYVHTSIGTTVTQCEFYDNTALNKGGGAYVKSNTTGREPTFTDCIFSGNQAFQGGGMYNGIGRSPTVSGCTFDGNISIGYIPATLEGSEGGGMYNNGGNPTVSNCTFSNNISDGLPGSGAGGGMYNAASSPRVSDCIFIGNETRGNGGCGGAMLNDAASAPLLIHCDFRDSVARYGAGVYNQEDSAPTLINCTFTGNHAEVKGAGMFMTDTSATTLTNCTFSGNTADIDGGGILLEITSTVTASNCTFSGNSAGTHGGGAKVGGAVGGPTFTVNNCIFWGNEDDSDGSEDPPGPHTDEEAQIDTTLFLNLVSSYTDIHELALGGQYCTLCGSECCNGNIGNDPNLIDADGVDDIVGTEDDDLRLQSGSPCIDAGDNNVVALCALDLDGNERFFDDLATDDTGNGVAPPFVDMGAYEFGGLVLSDCNANALDDDCEIVANQSLDCTMNGILDECDIASGTSLDCNANGVPDSCCTADRNGDEVVDAFDLASLLGDWGSCPDPCPPVPADCSCRADFDNNCEVEGFDLALLLGSWGPCP